MLHIGEMRMSSVLSLLSLRSSWKGFYTQGEDLKDLFEMLEDAIKTYLDETP